MNSAVRTKKLKILNFDIENRPIAYGGGDFTFPEITAIAASWVGSREIKVWALGEVTAKEMLSGFKEMYDQADVVTGHYIRGHDLGIVTGQLVMHGLDPLSSKLVSDTCTDFIRTSGISKSQENMGSMFGIKQHKQHMNVIDWSEANKLTEEGILKTKKRVRQDVKQNKELREVLISKGYLRPLRLWTPEKK